MATIVSALLTNINSNRNIEKYIEWGKKLCNININKVIFIEEYIFNTYFINEKYPLTTFIFTSKEELYLYKYTDNDLINFNKLFINKLKDTIEYMYVQCSKTEWVKTAIEINPYNSEQFIWVDFGIYHMINNEELFNKLIYDLGNKSYKNIRIASGNIFNIKYVYTYIQWLFLGSIFGGHKDKLLEFADLMKKKCIDIITNQKTIIWEINIWSLIYLENKDLFNRYIANHNESILRLY